MCKTMRFLVCSKLRPLHASQLLGPPVCLPRQGAQPLAGKEAGWTHLLAAGINDWGGVSPLTKDYVNPEKPWPQLDALAAATAAYGKALIPRCVPGCRDLGSSLSTSFGVVRLQCGKL